MDNRSVPRMFGPYVLTRPYGSDPIGGTFLAGTATGRKLAPYVLIRTFDGDAVDAASLVPAMETAVEYLDEIRGQAVARGAVLGIVDDVPFAGIDYVAGQALDRLFGQQGAERTQVPPEHGLLIMQKILVSLEATQVLTKPTGAPHGFLVPAFATVSYEGEARVFGAGLGKGLLPSLKKPKAREAFAAYLAPEVVASGQPSVAGDIYSAAAILYECLTGIAPTHGRGEGLLAGARLAGSTSPVPDEILSLLASGLATDPARREKDVTSYRKAVDKVLFGGNYQSSTFNLAFFMNQRFAGTIEAEKRDLAVAAAVDVPKLQAASAATSRPAAPRREPPVPTFGAQPAPAAAGASSTASKGGGGAMIAIGGGVVAIGAVAAWFFLKPAAAPQKPPMESPKPVVAVATVPVATPVPVVVGKDDPEFQQALKKQLETEMKRVEGQIQKEQDTAAKKRQAEQDRIAEEAKKVREAEEALKGARERADKDEVSRVAKQAVEAKQREEAARAAAAAAVPKTKDGDLVELVQVDQQPQPVKTVRPEPPPLARKTHASGTVLLRVLVGETGKAEKVEILRDTTPKAGLAEVSADAVRSWSWQPAVKDGKRVKTWITVPIPFKL
jgi:TonB family protein